MASSIFREKSLKRISSPEQLNDYIKVSQPSVWIALAAVAAFVAAVLIWSVAGTVPTRVEAVAVEDGGGLTCYLSTEDAADVAPGMTVELSTGEHGAVTAVDDLPLSVEEVSQSLTSDYARDSVVTSDWSIPVQIDVDGALEPGHLYQVYITTGSVSPISFLLSS